MERLANLYSRFAICDRIRSWHSIDVASHAGPTCGSVPASLISGTQPLSTTARQQLWRPCSSGTQVFLSYSSIASWSATYDGHKSVAEASLVRSTRNLQHGSSSSRILQ